LTTDLSRMILAARQIGEVTGEDLLNGPNYRTNDSGTMFIWAPNHSDYFRVPDDIALGILRDRVWRTVQGWQEGAKCAVAWYGTNWVDVLGGEEHHTQGYPDLPSAVAAIHKHWKESR
jgi:hypothetical protein